MADGNLGVELGRLVFEATMDSAGETALLRGEDEARSLTEYLTLMQFAASWRVALLFPDSGIDTVLDGLRRTGADLLAGRGLEFRRDTIDRFQKERFGQYYAALRRNPAAASSDVLAQTFLEQCTIYGSSPGQPRLSDAVEQVRMIRHIGSQIEQLERQVDVFVLAFMGTCPQDPAAPAANRAATGNAGTGPEQVLPVRVNLHPPQRDIYIELIAADLLEDVGNLSAFRRTLYRSASLVGAGGLALAGYETFVGNWLVTLIVGVSLLLAGGLANRQHGLKTAKLRQKWTERFSRLDAEQLSAFLSEMDAKHPLLLAKLGL